MTSTKHTPGPYHITKASNGGLAVQAQDNEVIARCFGENKKANARLIAAAPELLEAGRDLHAALFNLRKAYADVQEHYGFKAEQSPHVEAADAALKEWVAALAKAQGGAQ